MQKFDANSWELYYGKIPSMRKTRKEVRRKKRDSFNSFMKGSARKNAKSMKKEPSVLEQKMKLFLTTHSIQYEFQKILYIIEKSGCISRYYIADFFIPKKGIIIETDGKFHADQVEQDTQRTIDIQNHCGNYKVIRWRWHDFESITKMKKLLSLLV
jgi:very-short-patch-repair endonuclease